MKEVLEEHQQAIDWLNEKTDEKINFFVIKMEVWKIGNSEPAPKFHIISNPIIIGLNQLKNLFKILY